MAGHVTLKRYYRILEGHWARYASWRARLPLDQPDPPKSPALWRLHHHMGRKVIMGVIGDAYFKQETQGTGTRRTEHWWLSAEYNELPVIQPDGRSAVGGDQSFAGCKLHPS
jgi:hypothetical protein